MKIYNGYNNNITITTTPTIPEGQEEKILLSEEKQEEVAS